MGDRERAHLEPAVAQRSARLDLDQLNLVAQPAEDPPQRLEQLVQAGRPDHQQRPLAVLQVVGLQQARDPEVVVGVKVGEVDRVGLDQPGRALHLAL